MTSQTATPSTATRPRAARHTWVPAVAALAGAAWVVEVTLVLASRDRLPDGPLVGLYFAGIALALAAAVGAGLRQQGTGRRIAVGLGCCVLVVAWLMGLGEAVEPLVAKVDDAQYVRDEVPVMLAGLVLLGLAWRARARDLRAATG